MSCFCNNTREDGLISRSTLVIFRECWINITINFGNISRVLDREFLTGNNKNFFNNFKKNTSLCTINLFLKFCILMPQNNQY